MTGGSGVARPRTVAGEGAPCLQAAAAVLAQVGEAPAVGGGGGKEGQNGKDLMLNFSFVESAVSPGMKR